MTNCQIKQMICEEIIKMCDQILTDIESVHYWERQENCTSVAERYQKDLSYHKGYKAGLQDLYHLIQKREEEEYVQQLGIPDQAHDSVESLD